MIEKHKKMVRKIKEKRKQFILNGKENRKVENKKSFFLTVIQFSLTFVPFYFIEVKVGPTRIHFRNANCKKKKFFSVNIRFK